MNSKSSAIAGLLLGALMGATAPLAHASVNDQPIVNGGLAGVETGGLMYSINGGPAQTFWTGANVLTTRAYDPNSVPAVDGVNTVIGYCVDVDTDSGRAKLYQSAPLSVAYSGLTDPTTVAMPGPLNWTLLNGYNGMNLAALQARLEADGIVFDNGLSQDEAVGGTQAAVWRFAEGNMVPVSDPSLTATQRDALALAKWLIAHAPASFSATSSTTPLSLTAPASTALTPGATVGPFMVGYGGAGNVTLSVDNPAITLVDAAGTPLAATVPTGTAVYARLAANAPAGSANLSVSAPLSTTTLMGAIGRVGTVDAGVQHQAYSYQPDPVTGRQSVALSWTAAPPPATAVPTLGETMLGLLSLSMAALGLRRMRARPHSERRG